MVVLCIMAALVCMTVLDCCLLGDSIRSDDNCTNTNETRLIHGVNSGARSTT